MRHTPWWATGALAAHLVLAMATATASAQVVASPAAPPLGVEQIEAFLQSAHIVARRPAPAGVTMSIRATLSDGTFTHDAHIQHVDISKDLFTAGKASETGFRDSYLFNVAGYRLARLLGMANVPVSVLRTIEGKPAAVTWWIDDVHMDETTRIARKDDGPKPLRTINYLLNMQVFDELIQNRDRNRGNLLWTKDWTLWLIDHTRAFRLGPNLSRPAQLARVEGRLLDRLRALRADEVLQALTKDRLVTEAQVAALLARRDRLVEHFDARIARLGEAAVLFALD